MPLTWAASAVLSGRSNPATLLVVDADWAFTTASASRSVRTLSLVVLSSRLLTVMNERSIKYGMTTVRTRRGSRISRVGRKRAGALRMGRGGRANRRRIQERLIMGKLLPASGGLRYKGRTTSRARRPGARA